MEMETLSNKKVLPGRIQTHNPEMSAGLTTVY